MSTTNGSPAEHGQPNKDGGAKTTGQFSEYQSTILQLGLQGRKPVFTCMPYEWEEAARRVLSSNSFSYVFSGAGGWETMEANRRAFNEWKIVPRMLRKSESRDITTTLFGSKLRAPVILAPVGVQQIFHEQGEAAGAEVAAELGIGWCMSTASSQPIERVAAANGSGVRWYQLYWPKREDDDVTASMLKRAWQQGFTCLLVTLDYWQMAWRPSDLDNGYNPFLQGVGDAMGFEDPAFRAKLEQRSGKTVEADVRAAAAAWVHTAMGGSTHEWSDLAVLRTMWPGPIVLKGIQHVDDARRAADLGMEGIVVSNHGGRQVDGAVASLDVLPGIVEAVGDRLTVLFDSGIRTGADIFKALALGAKGVLVGRPYVYGLALGGKVGVRHVLSCLLGDMDLNMGLAGFKSLAELQPSALRHVSDIHREQRRHSSGAQQARKSTAAAV